MSSNELIAQRFEELARLLQDQRANPFRVAAWRRAATNVRRLAAPVHQIYEREGFDGLRKRAGLGEQIGSALRDLILTGRLSMIDRLRGKSDPIEVLASVPGIGRVYAARLHDDLGIDSLEDLEAAAHDGRLADIIGFGKKRIAGIVDSLASRLGRLWQPASSFDLVPVDELLNVDLEYREAASAGRLHLIAPRRFNPEEAAWLPILHTQRGQRHYTALFSNTARAHQLSRTHDWVVLYWDGRTGEHQATVVTAHQGFLRDKRVVRGREAECAEYYAHSASAKHAFANSGQRPEEEITRQRAS